MTKEEAIEQFLHSLPKVYYFIRQHHARSYTAIKTIGESDSSYKEGDKLELNILHFSTLWLIETLIEKEGLCIRKDLEKIFLWKHPGRVSTFEDTVINRLDVVGLIEQDKHKGDRRKHLIKLTPLARTLLEDLREDRRENIEAIFSLLGIKSEEAYEVITSRFNKLAENVWVLMRKEASAGKGNINAATKGKRGRRVHE